MAWKPADGRWSIAQVLDHLNKVHSLTLPKFREAISAGQAAGNERSEIIKPAFGDRIFIKMTGPNAPIKTPVPPIFEPATSPDPEAAVSDFFEYHDGIVDIVVRADDYRLREINVSSPVSSLFRPGFIAYLTALSGHEQYHWSQIEAIPQVADFPK
jgi:hypothetical protein